MSVLAKLLHRNTTFLLFVLGLGVGSEASLRSPQLKLVGHAITNEAGHL